MVLNKISSMRALLLNIDSTNDDCGFIRPGQWPHRKRSVAAIRQTDRQNVHLCERLNEKLVL